MDGSRKSLGRGKIVETFEERLERQRRTSGGQSSQGSERGSRGTRSGKGRGKFSKKYSAKPSQKKGHGTPESSTHSEPGPGTSSAGRHRGRSPTQQLSKKLQQMTIKKDDKRGEETKKKGEVEDRVRLTTNYIKLFTDKQKLVYEYGVSFQPSVDFINYRLKLLYSYFSDKKDALVYDGSAKLFAPQIITRTILEFHTRHPRDDSIIKVSIEYGKEAAAEDCAVLYNTLFKNCTRVLQMTRFKNKYYNHNAAIKIPQHKLEIWPGVVTTVDDFHGGVQLRCDIHHRILRMDTAADILYNAVKKSREHFRAIAEKELLGECVLTRYNNCLYRIDDIDWSQTPLSTFKLADGTDITFIDYYKRQYNLDIQDLDQPLIINRAKNERGKKSRLICLVPELCNMTGLNDRMRSDMKVMKDIAIYTRVTPVQRIFAFKRFIENLRTNEEVKKLLKIWGLSMADDSLKLDGRNLQLENIIFGNSKCIQAYNSDWHSSIRDVTVYRSVNLKNWLILCPKNETPSAFSFISMLKKVGPGLGLDISDPFRISLRDDRVDSYLYALRKNVKSGVQMVVCICPTAREDRYSAIKKFCCKEVPVLSQVINCGTLSRVERLRSVVQNVALQMNAKLGGASWALQIPFKNTMVCGIDTYHEKLHRSASVGGFVSSCDANYTEYFSKVCFLGPKEELVSGLVDCFVAGINYYNKKNQRLPERVIVFRDGVGEGQLKTCESYEVKQFLQACDSIKESYRPMFTFVVVQKRIATKIYELTENREEPARNPPPGTLIDHTITTRDYPNFYLVSQHVRNGTATPCRYVIVKDNSGILADHIQRLTYKFCHLYYNWLGTIRVPAPCAYAHKLAYLIGQNVKTLPVNDLEGTLYYL